MRRAPAFWWRPRPTVVARLLQPAGLVYGAVTARRMGQPGTRLPVPVICVGNLVAGGAGKTPTALALGKLLLDLGERPAFLSRGYGRIERSTEPIRVAPEHHAAATVGDEPLLLAALAPTYVSSDRIAAGRQAVADGATVLLLDDGLQNPALVKTASLAVVDGASGVGNGLCLPAGPLRASLASQWPHISAVCVIGAGRPGADVAEAARRVDLPIWSGTLVPEPGVIESLRRIPLHAFAGIGRPEKFFATLADQGLVLAGARSFPDHHRFTAEECADLAEAAERSGARLVTTTKDRARLPRDFPVTEVPVTLNFDENASIAAWLAKSLRERREDAATSASPGL